MLIALSATAYVAWTASRATRSVPDETGAAAGPPVTVARFENRTGDATLDPIGQMAADAVSQELPNLLETIQRGGTGSVPRHRRSAEAIPQRASVTGAYYLDGQNLRIQASLSNTTGTVLHATEPAIAPSSDPGKAVDLVRQRVLGAIAVWADPDVRASLARPPLYGAYREYKAGFAVFADDPATAIAHQARAIEIDPTFFGAYYQMAMAYINLGDQRRAREVVVRTSAMGDRWTPKERALLTYLGHNTEGAFTGCAGRVARSPAIRPDDLSTNYLVGYYLVRLNRPQESIDKCSQDRRGCLEQGDGRHLAICAADDRQSPARAPRGRAAHRAPREGTCSRPRCYRASTSSTRLPRSGAPTTSGARSTILRPSAFPGRRPRARPCVPLPRSCGRTAIVPNDRARTALRGLAS